MTAGYQQSMSVSSFMRKFFPGPVNAFDQLRIDPFVCRLVLLPECRMQAYIKNMHFTGICFILRNHECGLVTLKTERLRSIYDRIAGRAFVDEQAARNIDRNDLVVCCI